MIRCLALLRSIAPSRCFERGHFITRSGADGLGGGWLEVACQGGRLAGKRAPTGGGGCFSGAWLAGPCAEHDVADVDAFGLGALFVQAVLQGFDVDFVCGRYPSR